jgi:hypothetical protein
MTVWVWHDDPPDLHLAPTSPRQDALELCHHWRARVAAPLAARQGLQAARPLGPAARQHGGELVDASPFLHAVHRAVAQPKDPQSREARGVEPEAGERAEEDGEAREGWQLARDALRACAACMHPSNVR